MAIPGVPSASANVDTDRVRAQIKRWQERLLDLTKGNPLLGINRSRVSKLLATNPGCQELFNLFALEDEAELKMPRVVKIARKEATQQAGPIDDQPADSDYEVEPGDIAFDAKPLDLLRRLRRIFDNARTTVDERGVTTLHLSFGVLRWTDSALGESISPLCLVPCELESSGPNAPLLLHRSDEELQLNPALELYLRERHKIQLPSLPEEPASSTLDTLFREVTAVVSQLGWHIEEETWLSTYTFESLVLYNDLKALADIAAQHPLVIGLARAGVPPEASEALGEEVLDSLPTPERVPVPVLVTDSSQLKALTLARSGRSLVIHGPPGTGKSQTIANLIADALGRNKRVLFVSAKMAALDVVHDRLKRLGLDRFCLEAHSTKAGKAKVIEELRRTLEAAQDLPGQQPKERLGDLLRLRDDLNAYVRELHAPWPALQLTIYQAIGIIEKLRNAPNLRAPLPWKDPLKIARSQLILALEALDDLASQAPVFDGRAHHPWEGLAATEPAKPLNREDLESDLLNLRESLAMIRAELTTFSQAWSIQAEQLSLEELRSLGVVLAELATLDQLPTDWESRDIDQLRSTIALLKTAAANADELSRKRTLHDDSLNVPPSQALGLLQQVETDFQSWSRVFRIAYWKWRALVRQSLRGSAAADTKSIRGYLVRVRRILALDRWFEKNATSISQDAGAAPSLGGDSLRSAAKRVRVAVDFRTALDACHLRLGATSSTLAADARSNATALSSLAQHPGLREAVQHIDAFWPNGLVRGVPAVRAPIPGLLARCEVLLANLQKLHEWVVLQHTLLSCHHLGLTPFLEALGAVSAKLARVAFERRFYTSWANSAVDASPALVTFSGARREDQIGRFRALDEQIREASLADCKVAASDPALRVASAHTIGAAGDVRTLRRELERRKRFKPLRKLFAEIPAVLQALKPCFLMSPLSVSTFLRPDAMSFDLIVFDEASQLPTPEAVPAILRGSQVIVAGDKNQLPPTSFFDASVIFDDGAESDRSEELEPLESLLDDCVSIRPVFDETHLRWHYRSKDERLVRFSNHYFYREKPLITFPSPVRQSDAQGVSLLYVPDGIWDRGKSRTNRQEARAVARLVVEQLTKHPHRSLGTVAMNVNQREAIEESLDELMLQYPDVAPLLDRSADEPFFIKPLENVQGDERDAMIISVGYGKGPTGAMSYNFGPLNQDAGWRRLNVLVTRARWQTILVTSMRSHELSGINPNNRGASALRDFIAYAERHGELPADAALVTDAETNDFEEAVVEALRHRDLLIDEQVGTSEYRIDLAIRDPRDTTKYILGVECDGATYHSARTARDRDLVRQLALRDLGWRLYRVWSTDWFRDPDQAIAGVLRALEMALQSPSEESVPAPTSSKRRPPQVTPTSSSRSEPTKVTAKSPRTSWRYPPGVPYQKYGVQGNRELLLNPAYVRVLADQITGLVHFEGPMHNDFLFQRLKELNGVARAGSNVESNIRRAIDVAKHSPDLRAEGGFLSRNGTECNEFRLPGGVVSRPVAWISPEEIALAVLHTVEEQFG